MTKLKAFGPSGELLIPGVKWYIIQIPVRNKGPIGFGFLMDEIEAWLQEQINQGTIEYWDHDSFNCFAFIYEEDAMAFKLRWL